MADTGYTAKVILGNEVLMDLTEDTVDESVLLEGYTAHNSSGEPITGEMVDRGAIDIGIDDLTAKNIPAGFHNGLGTADINAAEKQKITPANIKKGVTILGVEGTLESGTAPAVVQAKTVTPQSVQQIVLPDAGYDYLSQVTVEAAPSGGGGLEVDDLVITTPASKLTFNVGEFFSVSGLVVTATVGSLTGNVVADCTFSPSVGTVFTEDDIGYTSVTISYGGQTLTYQIRIREGVDIVPWATGTDEQIIDMLDAYYAGDLDFENIEGWEIGAQRIVSLSACGDIQFGNAHAAQNIRLVLMHKGGIDLTTPIGEHTKCAFVVGMRDILHKGGQVEMGGFNSYYASNEWNTSDRRTWCNGTFKNALPSSFRGVFKQFKNPTHSGTTALTVDDYFSLNSITNLYGSRSDILTEGFQFDYYKTASNRYKYNYTSGSPSSQIYWTRTATGKKNNYIYYKNNGDSYSTNSCAEKYALSMFGVI